MSGTAREGAWSGVTVTMLAVPSWYRNPLTSSEGRGDEVARGGRAV